MKTWKDVYNLFAEIEEDVMDSGKYSFDSEEMDYEIHKRIKHIVAAFPENKVVKKAYDIWLEFNKEAEEEQEDQ